MAAPAAEKDKGKAGQRAGRAKTRDDSPYREDPAPDRHEEISDFAANMIRRYGSTEAALQALSRENYEYRDRHRQDKKRIDELEEEHENATILAGDDAKEWTAFQELKIKAADVKTAIVKRDELQAKVDATDRATLHSQAAQAAGYKPTVLSKLLETEKLHLEFRDVSETKDGKTETKKVPHVRLAADEKATLVPLTQHVEQHLKDFLPALKADAAQGGGGQQQGGGATGSESGGTSAGVAWPAQSGGSSGGGSSDMVTKFLTDQAEAAKKIRDPLAPKTATTS